MMSLLGLIRQRSKPYICHAVVVLTVAGNILAIRSACAQSGDLKLPRDVTRALHEVISATLQDRVRVEPRYPEGTNLGMGSGPPRLALDVYDEQWRKDFDELLLNLAKLATEDVVNALEPYEGKRIECNLVAIALDRQKHPEMYDELLAYYGVPIVGQTVAPQRRSLNHTEARHRLFWEYCTLAPADERMRFIQEGSLPVLALAEIQEDRSLPVLGFEFRLQQIKTLAGSWDEAAIEKMEFALGAMAAFESPLALDWSLQCVALTESCHPYSTFDFRGSQFQHLASSIGKKELTSYRDLATAVLAKPAIKWPHRTMDGWRPILAAYPVDRLSAADKSLVEKALSTYE